MDDPNEKEWTIMFYFASDNPLAPEIVTQLKALTNAGFHQDVNVIAHFDPATRNTDTHTFDVNLVNKVMQTGIGSNKRYKFWAENDPYIRNLVFDKLWRKGDKVSDGLNLRKMIEDVLKGRGEKLPDGGKLINYSPPLPPDDPANPDVVVAKRAAKANKKNNKSKGAGATEAGVMESLGKFLQFCAKSYKAKHYMLFLVGHGMIVGNDIFLRDDNARTSSLSLKNLEVVLSKFKSATRVPLELLGFHSCSMSSIEIAYALRGSTKYMLSSQGPEFVGSWPYRQILIRIFNDLITGDEIRAGLRSGTPPTIESSIERIFTYILRNSFDFQLAGYSFDLSLCDLRKVGDITAPVKKLSVLLKKHLVSKSPLVEEAIMLAHMDAQSFWTENYTDLYDFCFCLAHRCTIIGESSTKFRNLVSPVVTACGEVIKVLESGDVEGNRPTKTTASKRNGLIVRSEFAGPLYQYSHGLSIFFPWSQPSDDQFWYDEYPKYEFAKDTMWNEFLQTYFDQTMRRPVFAERNAENKGKRESEPPPEEILLDYITRRTFNFEGPLNLSGPKGGPVTGLGGPKGGPVTGLGGPKGGPVTGLGGTKGGPGGGVGDSCDCPSIKNYPSFTREPSKKRKDDKKRKGPKNIARPTSDGLLPSLIDPDDD